MFSKLINAIKPDAPETIGARAGHLVTAIANSGTQAKTYAERLRAGYHNARVEEVVIENPYDDDLPPLNE